MATYTAPTTRTTGALISASIWNTDIVENLKYFKDAPVFDGDVSVGNDLLLPSTGAVINFASGDVTITHSTNTLTFAGASSGYAFQTGLLSSAEGLAIGSTKRFYFDGVAGTGDTYIEEGSANNLSIYVGGSRYLQMNASQFSVQNSDLLIPSTRKFYLDGGVDTYIHENTANQIQLVGGNLTIATATTNAVISAGAIGVGFASTNGGTSTGTAVVRNADTYFYLTSSSRRFKENISPAVVTDAQLDAFMATTPSWWDYKEQKNGALGFIAEDLAALPMERYGFNPLVNYDGDGQIESNRDYALIAMHHLVIQRLERKIAALEARIH